MAEADPSEISLRPFVPARVLAAEPPIIKVRSDHKTPLGFADDFARFCSGTPAVFLLTSGRDADIEEEVSVKVAAAAQYRARHPEHRLIFICASEGEAARMLAAGEEAFVSNHNIFVSEDIFRPLPGIPIAFDAVYNARTDAAERHELAAEVERVAYVACQGDQSAELHRKALLGLSERRGHQVFNRIEDGLAVRLPPEGVNEAYAQASVGLCLSAAEGAMFASMEYMMAGLPIVSTPSRGGRDVFFDPDYCIIAEPNPRAVREAVDALRDRNIPRDYVRARALAKVEPERLRFIAFLETIKEQFGQPRSFETKWSFSLPSHYVWQTAKEHARDFTASPVATPEPVYAAERHAASAGGSTTHLTGHTLHDYAPRLVAGNAGRAWIDAMPAQHAYRCLPMAIANAYGWYILCPVPIEIEWNGGSGAQDLTVRALKPLPGGGPVRYFCSSHFGFGIATMHLDYIFRTDPGWDLLATGPFNSPKVNAYPLTGIVETDRLPFPFTMNWKVLSPGKISFDEGEPICAIFPVRMDTVLNCVPEVRRLKDDPELKRDYEAFRSAHGR